MNQEIAVHVLTFTVMAVFAALLLGSLCLALSVVGRLWMKRHDEVIRFAYFSSHLLYGAACVITGIVFALITVKSPVLEDVERQAFGIGTFLLFAIGCMLFNAAFSLRALWARQDAEVAALLKARERKQDKPVADRPLEDLPLSERMDEAEAVLEAAKRKVKAANGG